MGVHDYFTVRENNGHVFGCWGFYVFEKGK